MDPRLTDVAAQVRRLRRDAADAEWEGDPRAAQLAQELQRYEALQERGVLHDPKF